MSRWTLLWAFAAAALANTSQAAVQTKTVVYKDGNVECRGFLAWDDSSTDKRPGVLVVHEWWGLNDYVKKRAEQLAGEGYIAFAADIYGGGKQTEHPDEARKMATQVRENVDSWVKRANAALEVLKAQPQCDTNKLAAIGYCFGGSTALQLAFSGADLKCVASFHGALPVPTEAQVKQTKATLLICHGAQDSFIPEDTIHRFRTALDAGGADWEMVYYAHAKHGFTVEGAEKKGLDGLAYNKHADQRSWARLKALFQEKLK